MCPDASSLDEYINVETDVKDGDILTIAGPGEIVEFEDQKTKEKRRRLRLPLTLLDGRVKLATLNETTRRLIMEGYGANTEGWVGKPALVSLIKKDVFGQIKVVLYLNPVRS